MADGGRADRDHVDVRAAAADALGGRPRDAGERHLGPSRDAGVAVQRAPSRHEDPHPRRCSSRPSCSADSCCATGSPGTPATSRSVTASTFRGCETDVSDVQHHPCSEPHTGEVFFVGDHGAASGTPFTDALLVEFAGSTCVTAAYAYLGIEQLRRPRHRCVLSRPEGLGRRRSRRSPATCRRSTAPRCPRSLKTS